MIGNYHCQIGFNSCGQNQFTDFWGISVDLLSVIKPLITNSDTERKQTRKNPTSGCCKTSPPPSLWSCGQCRRWGSICRVPSTRSALLLPCRSPPLGGSEVSSAWLLPWVHGSSLPPLLQKPCQWGPGQSVDAKLEPQTKCKAGNDGTLKSTWNLVAIYAESTILLRFK